MTYREKRRFGSDGRREPVRKMLAGDIFPPKSPYDPELLKIGMQVPRLTAGQRGQNASLGMRVVNRDLKFRLTDEQRDKMRDAAQFGRTVLGKQVRQEVNEILKRYRYFGQVRG